MSQPLGRSLTPFSVGPGSSSQAQSLSRVRLFATPWTVANQAPLSVGLLRQEYWSRLPFPPPGDLPNPGIEPGSPALKADSLPLNYQGSPLKPGRSCLKFPPHHLPAVGSWGNLSLSLSKSSSVNGGNGKCGSRGVLRIQSGGICQALRAVGDT